MTKNFFITVSDNCNTVELTYNLFDTEVVDIWSSMIINTNPTDIRPNSTPWRGIVKDWDSKILELETLIDKLNQWIPNKIKSKWDISDENLSLNRLHKHFPELEQTETDPIKLGQLFQYNDLIHEIQSMHNIRLRGKESMQLIICPENSLIKKVDIPLLSFKEFTHKFYFGDLFLHYCHVGRHPFEIFLSNDINCPADQIIPQNSIYSYFSLKFFDLNFDKSKFHNFYYNSKLSWPYSLDDPKLAFGYIKMGELKKINNSEIVDKGQVYSLIKKSNRILNWGID